MIKRGKIFSKRGFSAIIVSIMLILLVIVATTTLWLIVRDTLEKQSEDITSERYTADFEINSVDIEGDSVTVKRNTGVGEISGLRFVVYDGANTEIIDVIVDMNELEEKSVTVLFSTLTKLNKDNIIQVSVVPILKTKSGGELLGDNIDKYKVKDSDSEIICTDGDNDNYYAESGCGTAVDCNDGNANINPGKIEGPYGSSTCSDILDNDCDGDTDGADNSCIASNPIIFEDDFSTPADLGWSGGDTNGWSDDAPSKWDWYSNQGGSQGATVNVVAGEGVGGKPALRIHWVVNDNLAPAIILQKYLHPTDGYSELYIRYKIRLSSNFYAGDSSGVEAWKFLRLHQNRNPSLSPSTQTEQKPPCDTRYIIITASDNPPIWGGAFSANVDDCGGSVTGPQTKIKFKTDLTNCAECGQFQSVSEWEFNPLTGELLNPTPQNWHTLEWHFKMNTGGDCDGTENGVFEMWIDGVKQTKEFNYNAAYGAPNCIAIPVQQYGVGWNSFYLFDNIRDWTINWASDTYVYVDNVVISTQPIGKDYIVGS